MKLKKITLSGHPSLSLKKIKLLVYSGNKKNSWKSSLFDCQNAIPQNMCQKKLPINFANIPHFRAVSLDVDLRSKLDR